MAEDTDPDLLGSAHRPWYGDDGERGEHGGAARRSRRASVVMAGVLGVMAVVLVISPQDLRLTSKPRMKRVPARADREAGRFVVSETDTLLSRQAAEVRLQRLFDMSSVTSGASPDSGGPAGAIIASATAVYEKASKLAGDPAQPPARLLALASAPADDSVTTAEAAAAVASTAGKTKPFAEDKGWSLAKEKSDMDHFYDSLDHNLVKHEKVMEAAARKKRAANAAFRATVAKAHAELRAIEVQTAAKEPAKKRAKGAAVEAKPAVAPAAAKAGTHSAVKTAPQVPHSHTHVATRVGGAGGGTRSHACMRAHPHVGALMRVHDV